MRSRLLWFLAIIALLACWSAAHANDNVALLEIQARYDELGVAIESEDWSAIETIYAPDFRSVDIDGRVATAEEELLRLQTSPPLVENVTKTTVVSVRIEGDWAYVQKRAEGSFVTLDPSGRRHWIALVAHSSDSWRKVDGRWRIQETVTDTVDATKDGVPIVRKVKNRA